MTTTLADPTGPADPGPVACPAWYSGPEITSPQDAPLYEKMPLQFYLTTHKPGWLWREDTGVPLFVSYRRLREHVELKPATVPWAMDSGTFFEVAHYGHHVTTPREYVAFVARADREIGNLEWAAPQDMMCEPSVIYGGSIDGHKTPGTGLSVAEHQRLTIANFQELAALWPEYSDHPEAPFMPVLQGWEPDDYLRCADMYDAAGVRLEDYPLVGLGSVCRRNKPSELWEVLDGVIPRLTPYLALHGFGMKTQGLELAGHLMTSSDSAAWSLTARREHVVMDGHTHSHCGNCLIWAKAWRERMLGKIEANLDLGTWPHWVAR